MGKLSKVKVGIQDELDGLVIKGDIDVGFTNSIDSKASETAVGGKGGLNLSGS